MENFFNGNQALSSLANKWLSAVLALGLLGNAVNGEGTNRVETEPAPGTISTQTVAGNDIRISVEPGKIPGIAAFYAIGTKVSTNHLHSIADKIIEKWKFNISQRQKDMAIELFRSRSDGMILTKEGSNYKLNIDRLAVLISGFDDIHQAREVIAYEESHAVHGVTNHIYFVSGSGFLDFEHASARTYGNLIVVNLDGIYETAVFSYNEHVLREGLLQASFQEIFFAMLESHLRHESTHVLLEKEKERLTSHPALDALLDQRHVPADLRLKVKHELAANDLEVAQARYPKEKMMSMRSAMRITDPRYQGDSIMGKIMVQQFLLPQGFTEKFSKNRKAYIRLLKGLKDENIRSWAKGFFEQHFGSMPEMEVAIPGAVRNWFHQKESAHE